MSAATSALRRAIVLVMLAVGVGGVISWRRARSLAPVPAAPPEWPDFAPLLTPDDTSTSTAFASTTSTWMRATGAASAPESHPIKLKESSGIFHVPGGRFYDRTKPDRWYATAADAEADGYRQSKS